MTANHDFERRLADYYETEAPPAAPAWVLRDALATIDVTPQRRVFIRVPWRKFPTMNTYAKLAVAAVAVIAIGAVGISVLRPGNSPGVGGQTETPSAEASTSPTSQPTPSPSSAPPLTQEFTSGRHGISLSYPEGWTDQAATEPWTGDPYLFREPFGDFLFDERRRDHLFLSIASQPLGDSTPDEWIAEKQAFEGCAVTEPIVVDGATGVIGAQDCNLAFVTAGGRGYFFWLYTSADEPSLSTTYDRAWFEEVLATVQLQPRNAVD